MQSSNSFLAAGLSRLLPAFLLVVATSLAACTAVDIETSDTDEFTAGNYTYYKWRSDPLPATTRSSDPIYILDPVVRREVDRLLQSKGYVLDDERAQFSVDYLYAPGLADGAMPEQASNIRPIPSATINRQVDQASVDNAIALGGVKQTNNLMLQLNDVGRQEVVWQALVTAIVQDANQVRKEILDENLTRTLTRTMAELPQSAGR